MWAGIPTRVYIHFNIFFSKLQKNKHFYLYFLGFDLENVDPKLKQFFSKAGVSERELQDKDTRDFIYDFIDKHGGIEAALLEVYIIFIYIFEKVP